MAWLYLVVAGVLEVVWAYTMKQSHGFSRLVPSVITFVTMVASFGLLSLDRHWRGWRLHRGHCRARRAGECHACAGRGADRQRTGADEAVFPAGLTAAAASVGLPRKTLHMPAKRRAKDDTLRPCA